MQMSSISVERVPPPALTRSGRQDLRSRLVTVEHCGLLVGHNRNVLVLNAAARCQVEQGSFQAPPGFLEPEPPACVDERAGRRPSPSGLRAHNLRIFGRLITIRAAATPAIGSALLPWYVWAEKMSSDEQNSDLTIEDLGTTYLAATRNGEPEILRNWMELRSWIFREVVSILHGCSDWFALLHAGGVLYNGRLIAFPGVSHAGKSTLIASLCMAGHPYFGEDCLPLMDAQLRTAALPHAIKLREPSWPMLRDRVAGFQDLPIASDHGVPVKFWQPPADRIRTAHIQAFIFPRFKAGAKPKWKRLPLIQTVFEILASSSGPVESTPESWRQLVAALHRTPAFEIEYGSIRDSHNLVEAVSDECL